MKKSTRTKRYWVAAILGFILIAAAWGLWNKENKTDEGAPGGAISIRSCGATADDDTDDYKAISACLEKAKAARKSVYVPEGNFLVSDILVLDGVSMNGAGMEVSTLTSTHPERGSIDIVGADVTLSNLTHSYSDTVERGDGSNEKNSITVRGATNFKIDQVQIKKASTAGIMITQASQHGSITGNRIEDTNADGIHITDGSSDIVVERNQVKATGDDNIAVVSYEKDKDIVNHIIIQNNDVGYLSRARGISVVGGSDVEILSNQIQQTEMAGIYISVEKEWETTDTDHITISKNVVENTGTRADGDHPNILVYASQGRIDEITFSENQIKDAAHDGIGVWGEGSIGKIQFTGNTVSGSKEAATLFKSGNIQLDGNKGF